MHVGARASQARAQHLGAALAQSRQRGGVDAGVVMGAVEGDLLGQRRARLGGADRGAAVAQRGDQARHRVLELDERAQRVERDHATRHATKCHVAKMAV